MQQFMQTQCLIMYKSLTTYILSWLTRLHMPFLVLATLTCANYQEAMALLHEYFGETNSQ